MTRVEDAQADDLGGAAPDGFFIAVEGGDGSGKSTQVSRLGSWLARRGLSVVTTCEPGGTRVGQRLRQVLLHGEHVAPRAEALLFAADRAHHVETLVRPALQRGQVVVTDRYVDSTLAYQGGGRGLDVAALASISAWASEGLVPDLTVLLDLDPVVASRRAAAHEAPDRLESEDLAFHTAVRERFLALAVAAPQRYAVVDAHADADAVADQVRSAVEQHLARR